MEKGQTPDWQHIPNLREKLEFLRDCIAEVEEQLCQRQKQWEEARSDIEAQVLTAENRRQFLLDVGDARIPRNARWLDSLDSEVSRLCEEKRRQHVEFSRDLHQMQGELRRLKKEYREARAGVLDA